MAKIVGNHTLITTRGYSSTTDCRHLPKVRRYAYHTISVDNVLAKTLEEHLENIKNLCQHFNRTVEKMRRARSYKMIHQAEAEKTLDAINDYSKLFGLDIRGTSIDAPAEFIDNDLFNLIRLRQL